MINKLIIILLSLPGISFASEWKLVDLDRLWDVARNTAQGMFNGLLQVAGVIFVLFIMFAGARLMIAGNDPEDRQEAKKLIKFSVIALIILLITIAGYNLLVEILEPLK